MKINAFLFILLTSLVSDAFAWGWEDFKEEAASPYTTDARYTLYAGVFVTASLAIFEESVVDPFQKKQIRNKTLGSASHWGDILGQMVPNGLYVLGMGIAGHYGDPRGYDRAIGMFKATAYASGVTTVLKYTIREPRPNDNSTKNSFPSGHSTTAFAFSGYIAAEHGWSWGSAALLMSTFTAYSRINDNMHRLHDVTSGATIGWIYGWGMAYLQKRKKKEADIRKLEQQETFIVPILDTKTAGLSLYREF
jgi:membrane-associated phospholipid phosphatase